MTEYSEWKTVKSMIDNYTDDLDYFVYLIYRSNDNQIEISRVKDLQNNITFNISYKGVTFCNVTDISIDEDDDVIFMSKRLHGMVGFIEKKHWMYD